MTRAALTDVLSYLPCDLCTKVDIASMAHGLEVRQPLLDHRVVEFAASLPVALKFRGGRGKRILQDTFGSMMKFWKLPTTFQLSSVPVGSSVRYSTALKTCSQSPQRTRPCARRRSSAPTRNVVSQLGQRVYIFTAYIVIRQCRRASCR